ncbi:MAG: type IV pilin [Halapricum sp.]
MHTVRNDTKAVSPVIGVILMVAITVLLAATAATFFLELGHNQGTQMTPHAAVNVDYHTGQSDTVTLSHQTGDDLTVEHLSVVISDANPNSVDKRFPVEDISSYGPGSKLTAGSSITLDENTLGASQALDFSSATVKLVWDGSGSRSTILREWSGPDA